MAYVEAQKVEIGDWVSFKADIEQSGEIVFMHQNLNGHWMLTLENTMGFHGDYIGGETRVVQRAVDCWLD